MANEAKFYFLAPGFDYPVGSIALGNIIVNISEPHETYFTPTPTDINTRK
ncbi:hypothetical protein V8E51_018636 [Hyaloscypha variabilis]